MTLKLRNSQKQEAEVTGVAGFFHGVACLNIRFGQKYLLLYGTREEMVKTLTVAIEAMGGQNVADAIRKQSLMPAELDTPETAWPWLVENCPEIFEGINLKREPYARYIRNGSVTAGSRTVCAYSGCDVTVSNKKYCTSACKQAAYRERKKAA